jgi:hypothetical protein
LLEDFEALMEDVSAILEDIEIAKMANYKIKELRQGSCSALAYPYTVR